MDISSSIVNLATAQSQSTTKQDASLTVLKKAIDMQSSAALQLIEALPQVPSAESLPANLGQNVNVVV